ncbi:MAG: metal-dependent phosphohydrolase [Lachnospiraceae bacterium]|nr:metal-dependent phosphohydrolase [Lachnospiraceae bacterium]
MGDYEREYTRVDIARAILDKMILGIEDPLRQRNAFVHLYGTGQSCALIAFKRGHDGEYSELACIAGMLHDFSKYEISEDVPEHAKKSALRVWPLLQATGEFSEEELTMICTGIANHSQKERKDDEFSEIIKDGDAMQHWLRNPAEAYFSEKSRNVELRKEFGIKGD